MNLTAQELDKVMKDNHDLAAVNSLTVVVPQGNASTRLLNGSGVIRATIPMVPQGKARARVTGAGGYVHAYTPASTKQAERVVREAVWEQSGGYKFPAGIPLQIVATFYRPRPKSKKSRYPVTKPDIDNYFKLVLDALNGTSYEDDNQVTTATIRKRYDSNPRIELLILEDKA